MNCRETLVRLWPRAVAIIGLIGCGLSQAHAGTIYSQDPTLKDFTDTVTSYATFSLPSGDYLPTTAILLAANYPRVIGNSTNPINVSFSSATNTIIAFDNIDHPGFAWDVFQYKISGSTDGVNYTPLFDPQTVNEANNPGANAAFTLKTFTGTAPTLLNNTITPGLGSSVGNIGYEEYFTFSSSYQVLSIPPKHSHHKHWRERSGTFCCRNRRTFPDYHFHIRARTEYNKPLVGGHASTSRRDTVEGSPAQRLIRRKLLEVQARLDRKR